MHSGPPPREAAGRPLTRKPPAALRLAARRCNRLADKKRNSGTFYFAGPSSDWTAPQNNALWRDAAKTLFDPCPAGWRVPLSGAGDLSPWHAFSVDNSIWNGANTDPFGGRTYDISAVHGPTTAWYPASGFRETTSFFAHGGTYTHNWPSTADFQFHTTAAAVLPEFHFEGRARAYSVRCIRE